jgi:hypothetical protein
MTKKYPGKKPELLAQWNQVKNTPSLFTLLGAKKRKLNFTNSKKRKFQLKIPSLGDTAIFWRISSLLMSTTWRIVESKGWKLKLNCATEML